MQNPFDFEIFDENVNVKFATRPPKNVESISCFFTSNNALPQILPFKPPIMDYIYKNASLKFLQKLQMPCKQFFIGSPTPICYRFEITDEPTYKKIINFKESSARINKELPQNSSFKNIHISTILYVEKMQDSQRLSHCLKSVFQCNAKYIDITFQNLTISEFKFLICTKQVVRLVLENGRISDEDGNGIMLEEVLENTPKIQRLKLSDVRCNPQTSQIILDIPFANKINYFRIENLPNDSLEPDAFADFVVKNAAAKSSIASRFSAEVERDYKRDFHQILKRRATEQWEPDWKPVTSVI